MVGFLDSGHSFTKAQHANTATSKILYIVGCLEGDWIAACDGNTALKFCSKKSKQGYYPSSFSK